MKVIFKIVCTQLAVLPMNVICQDIQYPSSSITNENYFQGSTQLAVVPMNIIFKIVPSWQCYQWTV